MSKVYISSTHIDLAEHRQALKLALERAGFDVDCMEKYPAFDERPADKCINDVAECDYYVLLLAWRYGFRPTRDNPDNRSITHLEYDEAVRKGKRPLLFLLHEDHPWPRKFNDKDEADILTFRNHVSNEHGCAFFTTPDNLASQVQAALSARRKEGSPTGETDQVLSRAEYLDWLQRECETVELLGLAHDDSLNVRLGQVYVPAIVPMRGITKRAEIDPSHELLLSRLADDSLYLPGTPGAGKSTFCRWLALVVATGAIPEHPIPAPERYREALPEPLRGRLPLLCRLREWAGQPGCLEGNGHWTAKQLEDALACWLKHTRPGGLTPELFRAELAAGRCLIILDGVDEVPEHQGEYLPRQNLLTGLADAFPAWQKAGNRILLTSRPYGLNEADRRRLHLPVAELLELPRELQETFVQRWFDAADRIKGEEKAAGLIDHLDEREDLTHLRGNPMLLTALCVKYDQGRRLPQDIYHLYDSVVRQIAYRRYATEPERERTRVRLAAVALGLHRGLHQERRSPAAEADYEEIDNHLADLSRTDPTTEGGAVEAAEKREDLLSNSGLLLSRGERRAAFYHLSFQEFLAATRLRALDEKSGDLLARHAGGAGWRRTLVFLFCALADKVSPEAAVREYAALLPRIAPDALRSDPNPALLLGECLEIGHARRWSLDEPFRQPWRDACEHALHHLAPAERAALWRTLGLLGWDDRPGVGLTDGLPDIAWVAAPAGEFLYGEKKKRLTLPDFHIARYPVTHAQYQAFIDAGGYADERWWRGLAGHPEPMHAGWPLPNHPREWVTWFEAAAFCRWLSAGLGYEVRLPTELEWERAARGTDGREYPWGEFESGRANLRRDWGDAGPDFLGRTSAVGIYPAGASPVGALDMAGNVWEWCLNKYDKPADTGLSGEVRRVVRGGSWYYYRGNARCASRSYGPPDDRFDGLGFRVVCVAPIR